VYVGFRLPASSSALEGMGVIVPTDGVGKTGCQFKNLDHLAREAVRVFVASVGDG